jgi:microcystin-dependent protein
MPKLNERYVTDEFFQSIFRDKDTGLPLTAGKLWFYKDSSRTELKTIYTVSGSPPNYDVIELPNPLTLSAAGTIQDGSNNDVILYLYPYDENDDEELYYVVCKNSGDVNQFTREGIPNSQTGEQPQEGGLKNYIPNGQFLIHRTIPTVELENNNRIDTYGGFAFRTDAPSFANHEIIYERFGSYIANPTANPRFSCRFKCTEPFAGTTFKRFGHDFKPVHRFVNGNTYTFSFSAKSESGTALEIDVVYVKRYGTGGDPTDVKEIKENLQITTEWQTFSFPVVLETNEGKSIGSLDDDTLSFMLCVPPEQTYDINTTNWLITDGDIDVQQYPEEPTAENQYRALFTVRRPVEGLGIENMANNLLLPLILTKEGVAYDHSRVSKIEAAMYESTYDSVQDIWYGQEGELECRGSTLQTDGYSKEGVPWSRLQQVLYIPSLNIPRYGTGKDFITTFHYLPTNDHIVLNTNTAGSVTALTDGSVSTGFTFNAVKQGDNTYSFEAGIGGDAELYITNTVAGETLNQAADVDTGFDVSTHILGIDHPSDPTKHLAEVVNIDIDVIAGLAGKHFLISNTTTDYYVWFKVDGSGTDPAVGGRTGILIDILSSYTVAEVRDIVAHALRGYYVAGITAIAASGMTAGAYFEFYNHLAQKWYVWYEIDGAGTDPAIAGAQKGIKVSLLSSDTAVDVAFKTMFAINNTSFSLPDLRGYFLRAWDHGRGADPDAGTRHGGGDQVGTWQDDVFRSHNHKMLVKDPQDFSETNVPTNNFLGKGFTSDGFNALIYYPAPTPDKFLNENAISWVGGNETRSKNIYVMYVIRY